jgi:hypothetical protein
MSGGNSLIKYDFKVGYLPTFQEMTFEIGEHAAGSRFGNRAVVRRREGKYSDFGNAATTDSGNGNCFGILGEAIEDILIGLRFCGFSNDVGIEQVKHSLPPRFMGNGGAIADSIPGIVKISIRCVSAHFLLNGRDRLSQCHF